MHHNLRVFAQCLRHDSSAEMELIVFAPYQPASTGRPRSPHHLIPGARRTMAYY